MPARVHHSRLVSFVSAVALAVTLLCPAFVRADVTLPDIISDGMVLQHGQAIPIWGKAEPGETVSVRFAGQLKKTKADFSGNWFIKLHSLHPNSAPETMTILANNKIELTDILIGEVWLLAGQSNMQLTLRDTENGAAAIAAADHPMIRLFNVNRKVAFKHGAGPLATWKASSPQTIEDFSAAGYYFGLELQNELHAPVGLINSSYGGSQAEAWTPVEFLLASDDLRPCVERAKIWDAERPRLKAEYEELLADWRAKRDQAKGDGIAKPRQPPLPDALREYRIASSIYDGMIAPLIPFAIRGAFWYQGESNEERAQQYGILLPTMIMAWRKRWNQGDFPFGIVQLPNYRALESEPSDQAWSHLREAQRRTAGRLPRAGLIVTIDIGEARNIHPQNKMDVGKRMCHWALADVYRRKMVKSGPVFQNAKSNPAKMVLTFAEVGKGLRVRDGDELHEFAISGEDRQWHWAAARIIGKNRVEVWSTAVPYPVAVRYAFNNNPRNPNLTNDTGLPAAPFRTDDWPGPTDGKR